MMEVSRTELSEVLLDFEYTHANVLFSNANTLPPEYRPSALKRKITEEHEDNNNAEEEVENYLILILIAII